MRFGGQRGAILQLTKGSEYTDQGQDYFEERYRQRVMHHLAKRAERLGFQLTPIPEVA